MNSDSSNIEKMYEGSKNLIRILINKGIPIDGLRKVLDTYLSEDLIRNSKMDYGLATVRAKDLKHFYMFKEDIPEGKMFDYIISSCYLPVFKMERIIDGDFYLDGGLYDKSPSNMLENKNYDKIYIVALNAIGFSRKKLNKSEIIEINPSRDLGKILNINKKEINFNIKLGFYDTIKKLKNLDGYKYIFKVKNVDYYKRVLKNLSTYELGLLRKRFMTNDNKELVIRSLEYIFKHEKKSYFKIYNPSIEILKIKLSKRSGKIYDLIKKYNIF